MEATTDTVPRVVRPCVILLLALLLPARSAMAAFEVRWPDARSAGMLAPSSVLAVSIDSTPGSLPALMPERASPDSTRAPGPRRGPRVTVSAGELYGVREAAGWSAHAVTSVRAITVGIELSRLGSELYEERSLCVRVGSRIDPDLCLDARLRGLGIAARGVEDRWSAAVDAGVTRRLFGRLLLTAACENVTRARIGASPVAARTAFGAALLLPSASLRWTLLLEEPFAPSTVVSCEAEISDWLRVRAGARDAPGRLGFGVGVGRVSGSPWPIVDLALQWHPELGVSSFVSVSIEP